MIRFSPKNHDMNLALRSADIVGHESPIWIVPVGDGQHVDIRAVSPVQVISIRVRSTDPVKDTASGFAMTHDSMHLLGAMVSAGLEASPLSFRGSLTTWEATNEVGRVWGYVQRGDEPNWDQLMVPPLGDGILIDPALLARELEDLLAGQVPALIAPAGDNLSLMIATETVSLWTLAVNPEAVKAVRKVMRRSVREN